MTVAATLRDQSLRKWLMYGSLMSALGIGSYLSLDSMVTMAVKSQLTLDPNGQLYPNWLVAPIALTYKFYIFNVDNPNEVLRGGKVRVTERGPYAMKQYRRKEIIEWSDDRSTVTYYEYKKFEVDHENTVGSWDDVVTIVNPLLATFGGTVTKMLNEEFPMPMVLSPFVYGLINVFFATHRERLFMKRSIMELIMGKKVSMLDTIATLTKPLDWMGITLDAFPKEAIPPGNMFGLLVGKNNTPEGPFEVYTGLAGTGDVLQTVSWKGLKKLKFWKTDQCNAINGSDGSMFKPGLSRGEILYAFPADMCRSVPIMYARDAEFMGIPAFEYTFDKTLFNGIDSRPENECYCIHKDRNKCRIDGLFDMGGCQFGAAILMTGPHFLYLPHLLGTVDGLNPSEEAHGSTMFIQPTLGAVLYGLKRVMFVVRVERNTNIRAYGDIETVYIPLFWIEESGGLNDELADQIKYSLIYPIRGASVLTGGVGFAGIATIIAAIGRKYLNRPQKQGKDYGPDIYADDANKRKPENRIIETVTRLNERLRTSKA